MSDSKQIDFIKNIIGLDWSGLEAERKTAYDERTFLNRKVKELDAKIEGKSFNPNLQEVDVSALNRKRDDIVRDNSTIARITEELIRKEVERKGLENDLKAIEDRLVGLSIDITKGENWLLKKKLTKTDEIDEQIKNASELNSAFIINEENGRLRKESRTTWENIEALEEQIAEIDQAKKDELANCEMPVKGLTFEDDKLFLNGLPFNTNQINTAKRIIAGLEIQFALMSEMKIARFDGSLLDKNSMAEVEAWAESKGIQLFVELVDRDGDILKIEISES